MTATAETSSGFALGFADYTFDAQSTFRVLLDAMARPGTIGAIGAQPEAPEPLDVATTAVALCLFDHDTQVWLGDGVAGFAVYEYLRFHCGCPLTKASLTSDFALSIATAGVPGLAQFSPGTDEFPDRSTTLIVQVPSLENGAPVRLTGPGIRDTAELRVAGIPDYFWAERREQQAMFPRGIDLVFTCGERLVTLPRSTEIEV